MVLDERWPVSVLGFDPGLSIVFEHPGPGCQAAHDDGVAVDGDTARSDHPLGLASAGDAGARQHLGDALDREPLRRVADGVRALVVPGSQQVAEQAEAEGLDRIFSEAGFQWRAAGCSMCLAMNPDKLQGREMCASSSNRNFKGRQGSPTGRTLLMSPAMVAAAAIQGHVTDVRDLVPVAG